MPPGKPISYHCSVINDYEENKTKLHYVTVSLGQESRHINNLAGFTVSESLTRLQSECWSRLGFHLQAKQGRLNFQDYSQIRQDLVPCGLLD